MKVAELAGQAPSSSNNITNDHFRPSNFFSIIKFYLTFCCFNSNILQEKGEQMQESMKDKAEDNGDN